MEELEPLYDIYDVNNYESIDLHNHYEIIIPINYLENLLELNFIDIGEKNYISNNKLLKFLNMMNVEYNKDIFIYDTYTIIYTLNLNDVVSRTSLKATYSIVKEDDTKPTVILL